MYANEDFDSLQESAEEFKMENKEVIDMFDDAINSYHDVYEKYEICLSEIKMLLKVCKENGIVIQEDEHCCGIIDDIRKWI